MSQVFSTVLQTIEERKASCLYQHKKMVHITRLRWLVFSLIIFVLLLGFVGFFFIRATSQGKSSHLHPNGTSTPFAPTPATPATPPTLIKSSTPTPAYVA